MNETVFETIASAASVLKLDFSSEEFAGFVEDHGLSEDAIVNIPGLGNRESGKMETGIPAGWKPLFR